MFAIFNNKAPSISDQREGGVYNSQVNLEPCERVYQTREREGSITIGYLLIIKNEVYQTREREGSITYLFGWDSTHRVYQTREREGSITEN